MRWQFWSPNVSILLNGGEARQGRCIGIRGRELWGDCIDSPLRILPGGEGEIRLSADWFRDALSYPYELWEHWETCVKTNGETDTFIPERRCPSSISEGAGARQKSPDGKTIHIHNSVAKPIVGWLITLRAESESSLAEARSAEFLFLGDSKEIHRLISGWNPPEWQPKPSQFGELEKLYAWYEPTDEIQGEAEPKLSSITWVTGDPIGTLDAIEQLTEKLEPHVEGGDQNSYLYLIRWLIDGLRRLLGPPAG